MKAFNKKRKPKHTTKVKWREGIWRYEAVYKHSKSEGITDNIFGKEKFKAYHTNNYIN